MKCEDIQEVLFDYMARELGDARSVLVREHMRKCEQCRSEAAEIQATIDLLRTDSKDDAGIPDHLSEERRARIIRALAHPVIHWIERHHILVSVIVTIMVIVVLLGFLKGVKMFKSRLEDPGVTVTVRHYEKLPPLDEIQTNGLERIE
ncbi:anti-sigma factor family protein [Verrucomicrobiota bacterium]